MSAFFFFAILKSQILLQRISDATKFVVYHAVTIEKYELLYKKKVRIINKERVYEFFGLRKSSYYGVKGYLFQCRKSVERLSFLSIDKTCMI